ncbi:RepB family plasmid replication initiator protein [Photobacterium chitinilyticum]|uniref:RepB family plasmid replication initiator protein n=1 Tax=Photobacterium chitinilyticum TaxID=2485123 RepID=UPI003D10C036
MSQLPINKKVIVLRQANALTTAAYSLTRNEKRIVYMAINAINNNGIRRNEHGQYPVDIVHSKFLSLFDSDATNISRDIANATKSLNKKEVIFYLPEEDGDDGEKALDGVSWTTKRSHRPRHGVTTIHFNSELVEVINKVDKEFTRVLMVEAGHLSNPYTMRLYESLRQWVKKGIVTFTVSWLCERYELPPSYSLRMPDFRRRFLHPSIDEINAKTRLAVTFEEIPDPERPRKVKSIKFKIKELDAKCDRLTSQKALTLEDAIRTYSELNNNTLLPSQAEIDNLKQHIGQLGMEGFALTPEFFTQLKAAETANKKTSQTE